MTPSIELFLVIFVVRVGLKGKSLEPSYPMAGFRSVPLTLPLSLKLVLGGGLQKGNMNLNL